MPDGLVLVGILAGQLRPTTEAAAQRSQALVAAADDPPAATVSTQTVKSLQWLLHEIGDELAPARKQQIGTVITAAELHSAAEPSGTTTAHTATATTDADAATDTEPAVTCEFCETGFESEDSLRSHWLDCPARPSDARFECPHCQQTYIAEYALTQHLEACPDGDTSTNLGSGASSDPNTAPPNGTPSPSTHRCPDCGAQFDSRSALRAHAFTCVGSETGRTVVVRGASGPVVHYDSDGYGFISTPALDDADVFFHVSDVPGGDCEEETVLEFDVIETNEGFRAVNISRGGNGTPPDRRESPFASDRAQWSKDT
ncbi:cold-shock protein [Haloplanus natans]|uniref:cold-shock protein n=1 Tax=Haloplanus natans TaxID=376171 RepID=UPI00146FA429